MVKELYPDGDLREISRIENPIRAVKVPIELEVADQAFQALTDPVQRQQFCEMISRHSPDANFGISELN